MYRLNVQSGIARNTRLLSRGMIVTGLVAGLRRPKLQSEQNLYCAQFLLRCGFHPGYTFVPTGVTQNCTVAWVEQSGKV